VTRRSFFACSWATAPAAIARERERIPTDAADLNRFREQYNAYVMALQRGVIDLARWKRVAATWQRLTNE
jgi:hypothetical protein